jgi:hypothetical protein
MPTNPPSWPATTTAPIRRALLHALASRLTTSMAAHAAVRGIEIEELESELEGDIDLRLSAWRSTPKGYRRSARNSASRRSPRTGQAKDLAVLAGLTPSRAAPGHSRLR